MALDSESCRLAFGQLRWLLEALWVVMLHSGGIVDSLCSVPIGQKNHGKFIIFVLKSGWCLRLRLAHVWGILEYSLLWCLNVDITLRTSFSVFQTIVIPLHTAQTLHRARGSLRGVGSEVKEESDKVGENGEKRNKHFYTSTYLTSTAWMPLPEGKRHSSSNCSDATSVSFLSSL